MLEATTHIVALIALALVACMVVAVLDAFANLLRAIARHRDAQADSVLHHAGLLEQDREGGA